jgi:methanol--5-hydroxybenzimidazolylcobamide Co-methyltransferase
MSGNSESTRLAVSSLEEFVYGHAPHPMVCGRELELGKGTVVPEINFTLPTMEINDATWPEVRRQYKEIIEGVAKRAVELEVPGLLVEFETLPAMTNHPQWGREIVEILSTTLRSYHKKHGLKNALRFTPNDTRDFLSPSRMRSGKYWDAMKESFDAAAGAGADLLSIESTGGKEVCDEALRFGNLRELVFGLSILGAHDMEFLWGLLVDVCQKTGIIPAGDSACAFGNTAMVLADQKYIPKVFAAVVRVASVPRSLVAYSMGAKGPSKDCAYEGPYLKAIAGVPISMEGRTSACAHLTHVGNIAQAVCDSWSNESVQYVRLLSTYAPIVSLEQLAYDCRLLNVASSRSKEDARRMRDWLVESDAGLDPQAWVLRPDVVLRIAEKIAAEPTPYLQTRAAAHGAVEELSVAIRAGALKLNARETQWLDKLRKSIEELPDKESELIEEMMASPLASKFVAEEYGLIVGVHRC